VEAFQENYLVFGRYEGGGIWEIQVLPMERSPSPAFTALVNAHHSNQLCPAEERALSSVGLARNVFFHVLDSARACALN
jgi:hypothetical protein